MALRKVQVTDTPTEVKAADAAVEKEVKTEAKADPVKETAETKAAAKGPEVKEEAAKEVTGHLVDDEPDADHQDDTAAPVAEVQPEERGVAVREASTQVAAVSEKRSGVMQAFKQELAAEGFEDLEVTGMSFERVRLHEGVFKIGQDDAELGKDFKCQILSTRAIFVVRQDSSQDAEMYYSYDPEGKTKSDGTSAEETLAEWRADGYGVEGSPLEIKPYREVMVTLKDRDDEYDEMVVSLSIPPAPVDRIAGLAFTAKQKYKQLPSGVLTECKVGKLIGEGTKAFRPWVFRVVETMDAFEARQGA